MSCSRAQRSDAGEAPRSRVNHSSTEPLRSRMCVCVIFCACVRACVCVCVCVCVIFTFILNCYYVAASFSLRLSRGY